MIGVPQELRGWGFRASCRCCRRRRPPPGAEAAGLSHESSFPVQASATTYCGAPLSLERGDDNFTAKARHTTYGARTT